MAQPGTQTRNGASGFLRADEGGNHLGFQGAEGLRVAEEAGHADQQIASEPLDLLGVFAQEGEVVRDVDRSGSVPCTAPSGRLSIFLR